MPAMYVRVLPQRTDDAYTCMAIDKVIAESVAAGGPPTLRFYRWSGNGAVSLSKIQLTEDIDIQACKDAGVQYVRRFTGGRAMYHAPTDLTYAIAMPGSNYNGRTLKHEIALAIISFLKVMGLNGEYDIDHNSAVIVKKRKICGSVNHYEGGMLSPKSVLNHGSIFYGALDYALLEKLLLLPADYIHERTTSVEAENLGGGSLEEVFQKLQEAFRAHIGSKAGVPVSLQNGELTEDEKRRIDELKECYQSEEWISQGKFPRGICNTTTDLTNTLVSMIPGPVRRIIIPRG